MKDQIFELARLSEELWNERKSLNYIPNNRNKNVFKKLEKLIAEIKSLELEKEIEILKEVYK